MERVERDWDLLVQLGASAARRRWAAPRLGRIPLTAPKKGKRSVLCDATGVPLAVEIAGADRRDFQLFGPTLDRIVVDRSDAARTAPQGICLDKGCDHAPIYQLVAEHGLTPHIRSRSEEPQALDRDTGYRPRRWVVVTTTAPSSTSPAA